jgi:hypothetical protein
MTEAVRTSETSVDNHFTRQYNPEDSSEHNRSLNVRHFGMVKLLDWTVWLSIACSPTEFHKNLLIGSKAIVGHRQRDRIILSAPLFFLRKVD